MSKEKNAKKGETRHPVLKNPIFVTVALTLSLVILFTGVTGIILAVRNARALVSYGGVRIEKSAAAYLATTYKRSFISKYNATDSESFWSGRYSGETSWGELLESETEAYIREVAVGAYLFDRYSTLTRDEKKSIKELASSALVDFGCADRRDFDAKAEKYGFDYGGFVDALTLIYKTEQAQRRIYGDGGSVLSAGGFQSEVERYYGGYVYAKLLFIRTEFEYDIDENGDYRVNENGELATRPLTDAELSERTADIAEIRDAIAALENGTDGQITEQFFDDMLKKYELDDYTLEGYYFSPVDSVTGIPFADATRAFAEGVGAELLEFIYTREVGEFAEIPVSGGVCFVYRGEPAVGAYSSMTYEYFFSDFYSDAANYLYAASLLELSEAVSVKDRYYGEIDITALPYNWEFIIKSGF
ncbi:MAG: hypothetical protein IJF05_04775 [Clostridia bacterium]|nr:hypothetical protein [Clostridia bacterium]